MNILRNFSKATLITTILVAVFMLAGCSPSKDSANQQSDAINEIRKSLELSKLPLDFVETTGMLNSPSGDFEVAIYQDGDGGLGGEEASGAHTNDTRRRCG